MKNIVGKDRMTMKECVDFFGFSRQKIGRLIAKSKLKKLVPPFPFIDSFINRHFCPKSASCSRFRES